MNVGGWRNCHGNRDQDGPCYSHKLEVSISPFKGGTLVYYAHLNTIHRCSTGSILAAPNSDASARASGGGLCLATFNLPRSVNLFSSARIAKAALRSRCEGVSVGKNPSS